MQHYRSQYFTNTLHSLLSKGLIGLTVYVTAQHS